MKLNTRSRQSISNRDPVGFTITNNSYKPKRKFSVKKIKTDASDNIENELIKKIKETLKLKNNKFKGIFANKAVLHPSQENQQK